MFIKDFKLKRNALGFERLQCISMPNNSLASINKCVAKLVSRDRIRVDFEATLHRTIKTAFIHYTVFYKFSTNEYRQFAIDGWEDYCGYMDGDKKNLLIGRIYPDFIEYTNVNHTCPYRPGFYFIKIHNLSINSIAPLMLVPSGRYRLDISAHEGFKGPILGKVKLFGSVSDHRVEVFWFCHEMCLTSSGLRRLKAMVWSIYF